MNTNNMRVVDALAEQYINEMHTMTVQEIEGMAVNKLLIINGYSQRRVLQDIQRDVTSLLAMEGTQHQEVMKRMDETGIKLNLFSTAKLTSVIGSVSAGVAYGIVTAIKALKGAM